MLPIYTIFKFRKDSLTEDGKAHLRFLPLSLTLTLVRSELVGLCGTGVVLEEMKMMAQLRVIGSA